MLGFAPYSGLTMEQMLQMYSLQNGWNLAMAIVAGVLLIGIIGFVIGLAVATKAPTTEHHGRSSHPHAA
jgi:hypothetical protein